MRIVFWFVETVALVTLVGCQAFGESFCGGDNCQFTEDEWARLSSLTGLGDPPVDRSNRYIGDPRAEDLGQRFYFDTRFSGPSTLVDTLNRPRPTARAPRGEATNLSCASCHDPSRAGADDTSLPGHVSVGAGWYDVNSQPTRNASYYAIFYWNGRSDSLWGQAAAVTESGVSMNGNRVAVARVLFEAYAAEYAALFPEYPLPITESREALRARIDDNGECIAQLGVCPADCREVLRFGGGTACVPRIPLNGKPGARFGGRVECAFGSPVEALRDAFDCMEPADRTAITRAYVNFTKAIAAYEQRLTSNDSPLDLYLREGPDSALLSESARRGAKLFVGKAACVDCHHGPRLTDDGFHNVGVPQIGDAVPRVVDCPRGDTCDCETPSGCLPFGAFDGLTRLRSSPFLRTGEFSDDATDDSRRTFYERELGASDQGAWRTPSLRDVAITAPYMHNGVYGTLHDVVRHYNRAAIRSDAVGTPDIRFQPLLLSASEEDDLVSFLSTLTGAPLPDSLARPL